MIGLGKREGKNRTLTVFERIGYIDRLMHLGKFKCTPKLTTVIYRSSINSQMMPDVRLNTSGDEKNLYISQCVGYHRNK